MTEFTPPENLLVGDADCSFSAIFEILDNSPVKSILVGEWRRLALRLEIPLHLIENWTIGLNLEKLTILDVVLKILMEWRSQRSGDATLGNLVRALKGCEWNELANAVSNRFSNQQGRRI